MTKFAKYIVLVSALIVALGWLAGGGSVDKNAAKFVERLDSDKV